MRLRREKRFLMPRSSRKEKSGWRVKRRQVKMNGTSKNQADSDTRRAQSGQGKRAAGGTYPAEFSADTPNRCIYCP